MPAHPRVSALAGSLAFVATWRAASRYCACRIAILSACRIVYGSFAYAAMRNAGNPHAKPRGLRASAAPTPPFFESPKKGGKESSPLATSQGLLPATRYALPAHLPAHGVARVARTGPCAKALPPACARQGQKKRRVGQRTKNAPPLEL